MKPYDVGEMLGQLKKAIIERVSRNGFDDPKLYNDELLKLDELDIAKFNELKKIVGKSTSEKVNEIKINELGMDDLQMKKAEEAELKKKQELTEEQKEVLKKLKEAREQKKTAISILRAVSIRMPMLVYGANVSIRDDITLQKFIDLVDEESWQEFMPAGLTKEGFREFIKYYDEDVFKGVAHSIRAKAFDCDDLLPTERIRAITEIFSTFKNPDKETVLTPWNVVNKHMTIAFGGHDFSSGVKDKKERPEWKSKGVDTSIWSQDDTKILEINSKSGLYPLLAAYNVYSRQLIKSKKTEEKMSKKVWNKVLADNIYVLCKSPMAKSITLRTIAGYNSGAKTNVIYIKDLVKKLQQKDGFRDYNIRKELLEKFNLTNKNMKFTAVVGNPPYQVQTKDTSDSPIYHLFIDESYKLSDKVALIHPARFLFNAGKTPKEWNEKMIKDPHIKILYYAQKSAEIFPNTDIKGGVVITYMDAKQKIGPIGSFTKFDELIQILQKVKIDTFQPLSDLFFSSDSYKFTKLIHLDFPKIKNELSKGHEYDITTNIFDKLPYIFLIAKPKDNKEYIKILGRYNNKREFRYIRKDYISDHPNLEKYKVILPKSSGTGSIGENLSTSVIGETIIGERFIGHTQTFISFGSFDSENEAVNLNKYIKTKFCRIILGTLKVTQHNAKGTWINIPLQDFTKKSDIDWSKSISEIDKQLYSKYGLDKKEIDFIESHVKDMK